MTASAVGRPVEVHAYADRIVIRQDGRIVAEHPRSFGRGETVYDPWHYVPVLARKPGALRTAFIRANNGSNVCRPDVVPRFQVRGPANRKEGDFQMAEGF